MPDQAFMARQTHILCASYLHWTGLPLIEAVPDSAQAIQQLLDAPFAVVSHDTQQDPVFNYANVQAQQLFGMRWEEITQLPSRYSAEEMDRTERARLLERVARNGYVDDYSGVRIAKGGRRFTIHKATVWNLLDGDGGYCGQAALIAAWSPL
jgi:hypothetical protein